MLLEALTSGDWTNIVIAIATVIIIPLIAFFAQRYAKVEVMERNVADLKESLNEIKEKVQNIPVIHDRVNTLWGDRYTVSNSPKILNDRGVKILNDSNISGMTKEFYPLILDRIKEQKPINAFRCQESLIKVVNELKNEGDCQNHLEEAAFLSGVDVDTILYVAAFGIRDQVVTDLGFNVLDIDTDDPVIKGAKDED
jgi:hypothetical protein